MQSWRSVVDDIWDQVVAFSSPLDTLAGLNPRLIPGSQIGLKKVIQKLDAVGVTSSVSTAQARRRWQMTEHCCMCQLKSVKTNTDSNQDAHTGAQLQSVRPTHIFKLASSALIAAKKGSLRRQGGQVAWLSGGKDRKLIGGCYSAAGGGQSW
jgi:hypothetical protein